MGPCLEKNPVNWDRSAGRKAQSETIGIEASAKGGIGVNDVSRKEDPARRMHLAQKVI